MHVLRLCSVFEPPATALIGRGVRFDPIGGMQNHTAQLSRALDGLRVRQTVVTTRPPTAPAVSRLGRYGVVVRLGAPVPFCRQFYCLPAWFRLPSLAQGVDLVHAHLGEDLAIMPLAVRAAAYARAPLVVTVHCSLRHTLRITGPRSLLLKTVGGALEAYGLRHADAVIALTERLRRQSPHGNVHVVPSGIGAEFTGPPVLAWQGFAAGLSRPLIGYVGRLHAQKGVDVLLRAFAMLCAGPDSGTAGHLVVIGDGPERPALRKLAVRLGIAGRIRFLGFVPHEQIPALLREMDALVLPSRYEELGSVLLEAMYCRVPVVASQVGGVPHLVEHGRTGLLVPPGSPARLADTLRRLLRNPALAADLAERAHRQAQDYTWDKLVHRVLEVYDSLLPTSAPLPQLPRIPRDAALER